MTVAVQAISGEGVRAAIPDLAMLRIQVFAAYPYLYNGDTDYEARYLHEFLQARDSVLVVAREGDQVIGAATAAPMQAQKAEIRAPFEAHDIPTERLFYFGESVLLPAYRGQGIGHAFFDEREAHAIRCNASAATFASVIRPKDHPAKPPNYRPLDTFWRKRGYAPVEGVISHLAWKDHHDIDETSKPMQYWMRTF